MNWDSETPWHADIYIFRLLQKGPSLEEEAILKHRKGP